MLKKILFSVSAFASLVKISHTIFALPFAFIGFYLGVKTIGIMDWSILGKILLCMFFARNAAMSFNRYIDRKFDAKNTRTAQREIPLGIISAQSAFIFCITNAVLLILTTFFINSLCFWLSPIALLIVLFYSYTKRFTALCHLILGIGLALAPIGAYIATTGAFAITPLLFSLLVLLWCAGFDILYSLPDENFDISQKLHSIPSVLGRKKALFISRSLHTGCFILCLLIGIYTILSPLYFVGVGVFGLCLLYQQRRVKENDISKISTQFVIINGFASIAFATFCIFSIILL
ncbi:MAG: UbiA-like polyprenyltransferase [Bacteroidales bacterium]